MKSNKIEEIYYSEVYDIPIDLIMPNPNGVRKHFDSLKMNSLVRTISEYGIIQPVTVREKNGRYELISGERRLRGAIAAGLKVIPGIVVEADDNKSAIMTLLENLQRDDLCFFEIAEGYKNLIRKQGLTQEELAKRIGTSRSSVANKIRLLRLPAKVRRLVRDFGLTERHARALLALPDEDTQVNVIRKIHSEKMSVAESERLVDDILLRNPEKFAGTLRAGAYSDLTVFTSTVNRAVEIMKRSGIDADIESQNHEWGSRFIINLKNN